jgi:hypothetical protein
MLYVVKALTHKNSLYRVHKFMVCKKRSPGIGFIRGKLGTLDNCYHSYGGLGVFNLKKIKKIYREGNHNMNPAGYKYLGTSLAPSRSEKKRLIEKKPKKIIKYKRKYLPSLVEFLDRDKRRYY